MALSSWSISEYVPFDWRLERIERGKHLSPEHMAQGGYVRNGSDSDVLAAVAHVRYSAHSGSPGALSPCLKSAKFRHCCSIGTLVNRVD
jgi:hypothetical protein